MATPPEPDAYAPSSLPSTGARALAFVAILVGGLCGGLIGYGFADLQCSGDCGLLTAGAGVLGAVIGAVVALVLIESSTSARVLVIVVGAMAGSAAGFVYWGGRTPELENETMTASGEPGIGTTPRNPDLDDRGR